MVTLSGNMRAYGGYVIKIRSSQSRVNQVLESYQLFKFGYPKLLKPGGLAFLWQNSTNIGSWDTTLDEISVFRSSG